MLKASAFIYSAAGQRKATIVIDNNDLSSPALITPL
jgi:hypothetical protein